MRKWTTGVAAVAILGASVASAGAAQVVDCGEYNDLKKITGEVHTIRTDKLRVKIYNADSGEPACCAMRPLIVTTYDEGSYWASGGCYRIAPGDTEDNASYGFPSFSLKAIQHADRNELFIGLPIEDTDETPDFYTITIAVSPTDGSVTIAGDETP